MDLPFPSGMVEEIEQFLVADKEPPGLNLYPAVFATSHFFPLQRQAELKWMLEKAKDAQVVMEIGADKGGGLYHWCKALQPQHAVACEVRGLPYWRAFERAFPATKFVWCPESSYEQPTVSKVQRSLDYKPIDVLFIDGDKGAMFMDFELYLPLMRRPGGLVFMHDIQDDLPRSHYNRICRMGFAHEEHIDIADLATARAQNLQTAHANWLRHWNGASCGVGMVKL